MAAVKTSISSHLAVATDFADSTFSNEEGVEVNIASPCQSPMTLSPPISPVIDAFKLAVDSLDLEPSRQLPSTSPAEGTAVDDQYLILTDSSSSASMDIFNKDSSKSVRFDISSPASDITTGISNDIPHSPSRDRIEVARSGTSIDDLTDHILFEARSFTSSSSISPMSRDARAQQIIQNAREQGPRSFQTVGRIRTTEEVLKLAEEVLSSRFKASLNSKETTFHIKPSFEMEPESKLSDSSSMTEEENRSLHKVNMAPNAILATIPSEEDDSIVDKGAVSDALTVSDTRDEDSKSSTDREAFSLLGFFRCEPQKPRAPQKTGRSASSFNPLSCTSRARESVFSTDEDDMFSAMLNGSPVDSMLKPVQSAAPLLYAEAIGGNEVDPRMPAWMADHGEENDLTLPLPDENFYSLGISRAVIVHEIARGDWTWCTAWSPDGGRLALATENHHLAVVEATASTVWRVRHDQRISGPVKNGTTHSIRSIAWGNNFIAIGGTGNAVSILAPIEPYPVLHTIRDTGFVGALSWRKNSTVLAIGSREDKCIVVNVSASDRDGEELNLGRHIRSKILQTISRSDWVNAVTFSPGGTALAIGDRSGKLSVYRYEHKKPGAPPSITFLRDFSLQDSLLDVEWSADGKWLYAGGEDFCVSVVNTATWAMVHKIQRSKWVQFISSSNRGSHLAVGGVASEVSILAVTDKWKTAMKIELKGLVPLSAKWHPKDQYLALTGQDNSVVVVETTNARHVYGHCLHSISPVMEVEFSPDGQMVVIGNEAGVVTFFALEGSVFVTKYEMVLTSGELQSIRWSRNGQYVVIGCGDQVIIVSKISESKMKKMPPNASGFSVRMVIRGLGKVRSVSIDSTCRYVAVGGTTTQILDAGDKFSSVREWKKRIVQCNSFSPDGTWLASIGRNDNLTIYNTSNVHVDKWRLVFTLHAERAGLALAWGPAVVEGLQYLAYGGANSIITIIEIRTTEETWETVLEVPRAGVIHDLDWNKGGMLAAAIGDGTVTIIDLEYLQSGWAMNEMDYTWQRQGITCFTEIRRNKGKNSMRTVRWIPSIDRKLLAIGGTDGDLEIVDLTERNRCRGYLRASSQQQIVVPS
jgi:WD40 repeat protein